MMRALVLAALLGACTDTVGTLTIDLATAPDSTLLSEIQSLRLTLTNPAGSFEAVRGANGLDLAFEIEAVEDNGSILIEGFDAGGATVAVGQSPPFPLTGNDGHVAIYVAPPYAILEAPSRLLPARSHIAGVSVLYGAVLAGGLDESAAPTASMAIYNAYDHSIGYGADMPMRRASVALAANDAAGVFVIGGTDDAGVPTSTIQRFQTNIPPAGAYTDLGTHPGLESAGAVAVKLGPDTFFVTGPQPALLSSSVIEPITSLADLPPTATAATTVGGTPIAAVVLETGVITYGSDDALPVDLPLATDRVIAARPEPGTAVVLGGDTRTAYVVAFASGAAVAHEDVLSVARRAPSIAATARHIVVAGGLDDTGTPIASADILDATTLELLATVPITPRAHAVALALPNDQVMLVGGDTPTELVELFTPPLP